MTQLRDAHNRQIDYLRMSVTDRCDFRCVYCMAEDMTFLPRQQVLGLEELERIARIFVGLGVKKIRLTGGEPLVRQGIVGLCERIAALPRTGVVSAAPARHHARRLHAYGDANAANAQHVRVELQIAGAAPGTIGKHAE